MHKGKTVLLAFLAVFVASLFFARDFLGSNESASVATDAKRGTILEDISLDESALVRKAFGVEISDVSVGSGSLAVKGKSLAVYYIGRFLDGRAFDNSFARKEPLIFELGTGQVIEGLDKGIEGMREGGVRRIVIAPDQGYGYGGVVDDRGSFIVPPQTALVFDVMLLHVGK